jgi:hypothetical protein
VLETTEHKCLQTQFSVLYNEAMQLKTMLELEKTKRTAPDVQECSHEADRTRGGSSSV